MRLLARVTSAARAGSGTLYMSQFFCILRKVFQIQRLVVHTAVADFSSSHHRVLQKRTNELLDNVIELRFVHTGDGNTLILHQPR